MALPPSFPGQMSYNLSQQTIIESRKERGEGASLYPVRLLPSFFKLDDVGEMVARRVRGPSWMLSLRVRLRSVG